MSYISPTDLLEELGEDTLVQLTADETEATEPNLVVVERAIDYAVGIFNSYARTRYSLPVPSTEMVKSVCLNLAIYQLYRKRATDSEGIFKVKKTAHDEAIALLKDVQSGRAALDVPTATETIETPSTPDRILTNAARAKFNDDKLSSF